MWRLGTSALIAAWMGLVAGWAVAAKIDSKSYVSAGGDMFSTFEGFHTFEEAARACDAFAQAHPSPPLEPNCHIAPGTVIHENGYLTLTAAHWGWAHVPGSSTYHWYNGYYCQPGARFVPPDDYNKSQGRCVYALDVYQLCDVCAWVGNPVSALTGQKRQREALLSWPGFELELTYDSRHQLPTNLRGVNYRHTPPPSFGPLWFGSHHRRLVAMANAQSVWLSIQVLKGNGEVVGFLRDPATGALSAQSPTADQLQYDPAQPAWYFKDMDRGTIDVFDTAGVLRATARADGTWLFYDYSRDTTAEAPVLGLLTAIRDERGRTVRFAYAQPAGTAEPRIIRVDGPDGSTVHLGYDGSGRLSSLQRPLSASVRFVYEDARHPWALTGVVAEDGVRRSTFAYDTEGRATSTEGLGGHERHTVSWQTPPQWQVEEVYDARYDIYWRIHRWQLPSGTTVLNPLGGVTQYEFAEVAGSPVLSRRTTLAAGGAAQSVQHDARGFVAARDDEAGMRTCWRRDELGRETRRVEGLPAGTDCAGVMAERAAVPPGVGVVTTEWHPDWKLPVRRAEPGQLTVDTYHGQPDRVRGGVANCAAGIGTLPGGRAPALLCFRDVVGTSDTTGGLGLSVALRAFPPVPQGAWTYDDRGQVLTAFDASAGGLTRFSYFADTTPDHVAGDLQAITNAAGHMTTFSRYNGSGQWLERRDPNGLETRRWFDARQRLVALDEGGRMTSFGYTARGALAELHEVDGTTHYGYDPTGRLTRIVTPRGDRIEYGLDTAGNRVHEALYDFSGVLRRRVVRTFDVQGRLVQQSGREIGR